MATWVANGTPGTTSATLPAGTANDDYVMVAAFSTSATLPTVPTGWTVCVERAANPGIRVMYREKDASWSAMPTFTGASRCVSTTIRPAAGMECIPGASASQGATSTSITWAALTLQVTDGSSQLLRFANGVRPDVTIPTPTGHTVIDANGNRPGYGTYRKNTPVTNGATVSSAVSRSDVWSTAQVEVRDVAPPVPVTQGAYQFFADGSEAGSTALAAQDTAITLDTTASDPVAHLRMRLGSTAAGVIAATDDWCVQWEKNGNGTWTDVVPAVMDSATGSSLLGFDFSSATGNQGWSQSFTGNGAVINGAVLTLGKIGAPTFNVTIGVYAHSGTFGTSSIPTGTALTSVTFAASTVSAGAEYPVVLPNFQTVAGTKYVLAATASAVGTLSNCLTISAATDTGHGGNSASRAASVWTPQAGQDLIFRVTSPATNVLAYPSTAVTDQAATTNRLSAGSGSFIAGKVSLDGLVDDLGWTDINYTEVLFPIRVEAASVTNGDVLRFRILRNDSVATMTWSATPTINITKTLPAVTQDAYRFYAITGFEDEGAALADQDTPITGDVSSADHLSMLRVRMQSTTAADLPATDDFRLQFQVNAGAWTNVTTTSGAIQSYNAPNVGNNEATVTERLTGGTGTFEVAKVSETGTANNIGFLGNNHIEILYTLQLQASLLVNGDIVRFQVLRNGVTTSVTYTQIPTINVTKAVPAVSQDAYRFYDDTGTEAGAAPLAAQNTPIVGNLSHGDGFGALRIRLQSTTAAPLPSTDDWSLRWERNNEGFWNNSIGTYIDSYTATSTGGSVLSTVGRIYGQSFRGKGKRPSLAGFYLSRVGNPTGTLDVVIYAHTGAYGNNGTGTGSPLVVSTTTKACSEIQTGADGWHYFNFDAAAQILTNATAYVVGLRYTGTSGDGSNYILVNNVPSSPTHGGIGQTFNGTSWSAVAGTDVLFEVYSGAIVVPYDNPNLTGLTPTTERLTGGSGTFFPGKVTEAGLASNIGWTGNNYTEVLYSLRLVAAELIDGDVLKFRVFRNGSTNSLTYTAMPEIVILAPNKGLAIVSHDWTQTAVGEAPETGPPPNTGTAAVSWDETLTATGATPVVGQFIVNPVPTTATRNDFGDFVGMSIMVGAEPITVTHLGRWTVTGSSKTHLLKIVTASTKIDLPGGSVTVDCLGATPDQFLYGQLPAPVTLAANTRYYIGGDNYPINNDRWHEYQGGYATTSVADLEAPVYYWAGDYLTLISADGMYGPVDFKYSTGGVEPPKTGSAVASWSISSTAVGQRVPEAEATTVISWALTAAGVRVPKTSVTVAHTWVSTASGKKTAIASAIATWTETLTATGKRTPKAAAIATWAETLTATGKRFPKGSAPATWLETLTAVGKTFPLATAAATWLETLTSTGKRTPKATATAAVWDEILTAAGKRTPKATPVVTHSWTQTATGIKPVVGMKQGTATALWTETQTGTGKRTPKATAPATWDETLTAAGKKVPKGTAPATWLETLTAVGKRIASSAATVSWSETLTATGKRSARATTAATWEETQTAVGKRNPKASPTATHSWTQTAQGVKPIVGVKQGTALVTHSWTQAGTGKRTPRATATAVHDWTLTAAGKKAQRGTAAAVWTETQTATGKRVAKATTAATWLETLTTTGKRVAKGTAPTTWDETLTAAGKRVARTTVAATHLWTLLAQGVKPIIGVKQGTAAATWSATVVGTGKRVPKATATAAHSWVQTASGTKPLGGTATVSALWTSTSTGKKPSLGSATVGHLWQSGAVGKRLQTGAGSPSHTWVSTAEGQETPKAEGDVQFRFTQSAFGTSDMGIGTAMWNGQLVVEMQYGEHRVQDWLLVPT